MKINKFSLLVILLASAIGGAHAVYECPLPDAPPLAVHATTSSSGGGIGTLSLSTTAPSAAGPKKDFLCLLSLLAPGTTNAVRKPVARTYGGRDWEVKAGPFAERIDPPVCADGTCSFALPPAISHLAFYF